MEERDGKKRRKRSRRRGNRNCKRRGTRKILWTNECDVFKFDDNSVYRFYIPEHL
jgi:hypothetical protein